MMLDYSKQTGDARVLGQPVTMTRIRIGRNCLVRGLTVRPSGWHYVGRFLDVSKWRIL